MLSELYIKITLIYKDQPLYKGLLNIEVSIFRGY